MIAPTPSDAFSEAFLKLIREIEELTDPETSLISVPITDDSEWWASWNIKVGGRTYVLDLHRLKKPKPETEGNGEVG